MPAYFIANEFNANTATPLSTAFLSSAPPSMARHLVLPGAAPDAQSDHRISVGTTHLIES